MPIKKASFKDLRQSKGRADRNFKIKESIHFLIKKSRKSLEKGDFSGAKTFIAQAIKVIDRAAQKGIIKKNTAARKKSRLAQRLRTKSKK